jgi:hypothetical protein
MEYWQPNKMKLVAEYVADAVKFRHMAALEKNPEVKARLEEQAAAYRTLAAQRAKAMGILPPDDPE